MFFERIRTTLNKKVLFSILFAISLVVVFMELANFYVLSLYEKRAEENYNNSLMLYSKYWDGKLKIINNSVLTVVSGNNDSYSKLCHGESTLEIETNRTLMVRKLDEVVQMHNQEIIAFCYVPDRGIYIKSTNNLDNYQNRKTLDIGIKEYITTGTIRNSGIWGMHNIGEKRYFIVIYHMDNGYAGAAVECDYILKDLINDELGIGSAAFLSQDDDVVHVLGSGVAEPEGLEGISFFSEDISLVGHKIGFAVSGHNLYGDKLLFFVIMLIVFVLGIAAVYIATRTQGLIVLGPLEELRLAMVEFSRGNMEKRIDKTAKSEEIQTLYQTFNNMAGQIAELKIDIYESAVQNLKIQSSYLRVQIQPHFYTNILNLINSLTQVGDTESIQKITVATAGYFRYLLSNKEALVPLSDELKCVENYVKIQSIRYKDFLEYNSEVNVSSVSQMVPPLIIQTFVENSIVHNITTLPKLIVSLKVFIREEMLCFTIEDNGLGFDYKIMSDLNSGVDISEGGKHIGIVNIKQRLKLIYGTKAYVAIVSEKGKTVITVALPIGAPVGNPVGNPNWLPNGIPNGSPSGIPNGVLTDGNEGEG